MLKVTDHVLQILAGLPNDPGIYQYFNADGNIIYIGKAKNLRKRVSSYFAKEHDSAKTNLLVRQIADVKYILTETEFDALLLENNLIKKHQPKYNISLKDDKTYPWMVIKNEHFPRVFYTRKFIRDGSSYFGPYTNFKVIGTIMELISQLFKLRNCAFPLTQENISKGKFKVCLEYHIGNCKGPCQALQTEEDYNQDIEQIREILKGNINNVIKYLETQMQQFATDYKFEKAQEVKEKIDSLENYKSKSVIVSPTIHNVDVFTIVMESNSAFVNYMRVNNGSIVVAQTIELKRKLDESVEEILSLAIAELRTRFNSTSKEILVNILPDSQMEGIEFIIPKIGDKKHLLQLSEKNARYYMKEKLEQYDRLNPDHKTERLMELMKKDLRMSEQPRHIECFDNSNFQGTNAVAAMSVFKDGKPSKKDYRHFNIKTVEGVDDFASMEEVVYRRYSRVLEEKQPLPQLIVIDGGKGQLSAALSSLEKLNLRGKVQIIGIAKKLEELYFPNDPVPLYLDKKGETLRIIQQLRDEVHRFGITHHRNKRSKGAFTTQLENIKGIGENTANDLLTWFKSVKRIKEASLEELEEAAGKTKAKLVYDYFKSEGSAQ
ncbi:MAG TPA: excinuclease ABC subunit UvrC [Bacteroidia bacterium]|nr:excinuclease ABC subunit UvrC [Bacteroidia bacterium]HNU32624.1 excinuclease ABC subunit UvrC [Bacteroidia bacterium]